MSEAEHSALVGFVRAAYDRRIEQILAMQAPTPEAAEELVSLLGRRQRLSHTVAHDLRGGLDAPASLVSAEWWPRATAAAGMKPNP